MTVKDFLEVYDDAWVEIYSNDDEDIVYASYQERDLPSNDIKNCKVIRITAYNTTKLENTMYDVFDGDLVFVLEIDKREKTK